MSKEFQQTMGMLKRQLPHGAIKEITQNKTSKKVLLRRMWTRNSVSEMTDGEKALLKEVVKKAAKRKLADNKLEATIKEIAQ